MPTPFDIAHDDDDEGRLTRVLASKGSFVISDLVYFQWLSLVLGLIPEV